MKRSISLTPELVEKALSTTVWDFMNDVLYRLCRNNSGHTRDDVILAKIWIIGRTYAAAIERGSNATKKPLRDVNKLASKIRTSPIDTWFHKLRLSSTDDLVLTVETHKKVMDLFCEISGLEKRSLASKYLHFHFPTRFYIYDSRASKGITKLIERVDGGLPARRRHDDVYARFFVRCEALRQKLVPILDRHLSPREIDKILLYSAR